MYVGIGVRLGAQRRLANLVRTITEPILGPFTAGSTIADGFTRGSYIGSGVDLNGGIINHLGVWWAPNGEIYYDPDNICNIYADYVLQDDNGDQSVRTLALVADPASHSGTYDQEFTLTSGAVRDGPVLSSLQGGVGPLKAATAGHTYGPDAVTNGGFGDTSAWAVTPDSSISGGVINLKTNVGTADHTAFSQMGVLTNGQDYYLSYDVVRYVEGRGRLTSTDPEIDLNTGVGRHGVFFVADTTTFAVKRIGQTDIDLDNIAANPVTEKNSLLTGAAGAGTITLKSVTGVCVTTTATINGTPGQPLSTVLASGDIFSIQVTVDGQATTYGNFVIPITQNAILDMAGQPIGDMATDPILDMEAA